LQARAADLSGCPESASDLLDHIGYMHKPPREFPFTTDKKYNLNEYGAFLAG
jgi:hypothetical protein